jgi:hypothetical protein
MGRNTFIRLKPKRSFPQTNRKPKMTFLFNGK